MATPSPSRPARLNHWPLATKSRSGSSARSSPPSTSRPQPVGRTSSTTTPPPTASATPPPAASHSNSRLSTLDDFGGGSLAAAPTAPVNITPPSISGTTTVGQQLTTTTGSWSGQPAPTFSYQWRRCDTQGANCSPGRHQQQRLHPRRRRRRLDHPRHRHRQQHRRPSQRRLRLRRPRQLRQLAAGQHHAAVDLRHHDGRPAADDDDRQLVRAAGPDLQLPVAPLRHPRRQLQPGRHQQQRLHPRRRRRRLDHPRHRHRQQHRRPSQRRLRLRRPRQLRQLAAGQHHAAVDLRHHDGRPAADDDDRQLVRAAGPDLQLPVAPLRHPRRQLQPGRHQQQRLHPRRRRRRLDHPRHRHRQQHRRPSKRRLRLRRPRRLRQHAAGQHHAAVDQRHHDGRPAADDDDRQLVRAAGPDLQLPVAPLRQPRRQLQPRRHQQQRLHPRRRRRRLDHPRHRHRQQHRRPSKRRLRLRRPRRRRQHAAGQHHAAVDQRHHDVGQQLTTTTGSWSGQPAPTFSYQWRRCDSQGANCSPVGTNSNATPSSAATPARPSSSPSPPTTPPAKQAPTPPSSAPSAPPTRRRQHHAAVDQRHHDRRPAADDDDRQLVRAAGPDLQLPVAPLRHPRRQLQPRSAPTATAYTLVGGDAGSTILVTVTATNTAGQASADSAFVGPVSSANSPPANITPPSISGTTTVGQQLTTTTGSWSGQPAPTFSYQWRRCDTQGANCSPVGTNSNATPSSAATPAQPSSSPSPPPTPPAKPAPTPLRPGSCKTLRSPRRLRSSTTSTGRTAWSGRTGR